MTSSRVFFAGLAVVTALLLQTSVVTRLPLPGGGPELVLLVVVALALAQGPATGLAVGFGAGLLADSLSDHPLGLLALAFCLAGYLVGVARDEIGVSIVPILFLVAASAAGTTFVYAGLGVLLGDPRYSWSAVAGTVPATVLYSVLLAPFVVPPIAALSRWLDLEADR